jgi:hypothetical protein
MYLTHFFYLVKSTALKICTWPDWRRRAFSQGINKEQEVWHPIPSMTKDRREHDSIN